jgi:pyruvate-formate lyase-activating enzyme
MIVKFCKDNDIRIIAYTYNEPTIFFEYLRDVSLLAKKE